MQKQTTQDIELNHQTQAPTPRPTLASHLAITPLSGINEPDVQPGDELFSAIISEHFVYQGTGEADWSISPTASWIIISPHNVQLPEQGWKLHVSAGLCTAETVLRRVLPILRAERVHFKLASTLNQLRSLNHGLLGASQVGKFLTVYSIDDEQAVRLGQALDEATRGLRGPDVPSDHSLHADSLVSYRYGGYTSKLMHTPAGKIVAALRTPTGELVPDTRQRDQAAPSWLQDPFLAAGVATQPARAARQLIGGRYVLLFPLAESARGGTSLGVDILQGRSCVLKYARKNAFLDMDGQDARDMLRYEAQILERLATEPVFPTLYDLLEQDTTLYMVMEEIAGETLGQRAERLFAEGYLPMKQVVAWGRALTAILGKMHARKLVYRDLKPTNIIMTGDLTLRLIDFELTLEQGSKHTKSDIGTRGFMSPQHQAGQATHSSDDIYSLGALLYYLVTRASPSLAPDPAYLLQRPLEMLNPELDPAFGAIIKRCLEPESEHRFPSMDALDAALATFEETLPVLVTWSSLVSSGEPWPTPSPGPESDEESTHHYQILASRLGETLCQTAISQPGQPGVTWLSTEQFASGRPLRAINAGCSGTLLALAELVESQPEPVNRSILEAGAQWLLHSDSLIANPVPGLYVGESGVGAALLRAGQVLDNQALIAAAADKGRQVARQPYNCQDLMSGAAGLLRFHLLLWDETHDVEHLQAAVSAGNWLISLAEDAGEGAVCWTLPEEFTGMTYVGYAHGAAGIADALLDLFEVTRDQRFLAPALGTFRLLERLAVPVFHDRSGRNWPLYVSAKKREMAGIYWCHGAAGIGTFLLHLHSVNPSPQIADLTRRAAWTTARGSRWTGPNQCHGLAGNIEFLLDVFQSSGEQTFLREAFSLARLLEAFATEQGGQLVWPSDEPSRVSPDYLLGYAGVLVCLLRLARPTCQPRQLSRRGFRHIPTLQPGFSGKDVQGSSLSELAPLLPGSSH